MDARCLLTSSATAVMYLTASSGGALNLHLLSGSCVAIP